MYIIQVEVATTAYARRLDDTCGSVGKARNGPYPQHCIRRNSVAAKYASSSSAARSLGPAIPAIQASNTLAFS